MKISVVIPTYNRKDDLGKCLDSIFIQEVKPYEVIVVDNSNNNETELYLKGKGIKYVRNKENSLTSAKNLGVKMSSGDIVSFLDDDMVLDKGYYKEILNVYSSFPALGVEGKPISNGRENALIKLFEKIFFLGFEENRCRLFPSLGNTNYLGDKIINCEWLSGASTFKSRVFKEFLYDENLKKYSDGEDIDFSYRVFKKYPKSLFINPSAKYIHNLSRSGRISNKEAVYMREIYYLYIFYKVIPQKTVNKVIYIWARLGSFIYNVIKSYFMDLPYLLGAYGLCLSHLKDIKKGNLDFFKI